MLVYLKLAWRNIWRNKRRTLITQFSMIVTLALMIAYSGLVWGLLNQMERNATLLGPGEIQIHVPGYRDDRSIYKVIDRPDTIISSIEKNGARAASRLQGFGLVSHDENSSGAQILGIDPAREKNVTRFHRHLFRGAFLAGANEVIVGSKIAVTLDVTVGDELVVVTQAADGSIGNDIYTVAGILNRIGEEIDRSAIMMSLADFRDLFSMGDVATEIAIRRVHDRQELGELRDVIAGGIPALEVKTWKELFPAISDMIDIADLSIYILFFIVYLAASLITLNTMLMAVYERIRELGIMMAIGFRPLQVMTLIFVETFYLTLCAVGAGLVCGVGLSAYLTRYGLDLTSFSDGFSFAGILAEPHWFAVTNAQTVLPAAVFLVIISFAAVLYPALKAARLKPLEALNFN